MCGRYFLGDSRELGVIAKEAEASPLSLRMKTALGKDLNEALDKAYAAVDEIGFENMHCRRDIGAKVRNLK